MAMVTYLFTCGFVCANSNVYSTCSIHTDSKCITVNTFFVCCCCLYGLTKHKSGRKEVFFRSLLTPSHPYFRVSTNVCSRKGQMCI